MGKDHSFVQKIVISLKRKRFESGYLNQNIDMQSKYQEFVENEYFLLNKMFGFNGCV